MDRTPTTDYTIVSMAARSKGGTEPDTVAEKIMARMYLIRGDNRPMYQYAVPFPAYKGLMQLRTWREGGSTRGEITLDLGSTEVRLDNGVVDNMQRVEGGSQNLRVTLMCTSLFRAVIECRLVEANSAPTIPHCPVQNQNTPPSTTISKDGGEETDLPLATILGSNSSEPSHGMHPETGAEPEICTSGPITPEPQIARSEPPLGTTALADNVRLQTVTPETLKTDHGTNETDKKRQRTSMKKNPEQEQLITRVIALFAEKLGTTPAKILNPDGGRNSHEAIGRYLAIHTLKDLIGIKPLSLLPPVFTPGNKNTGGLYGPAKKGAELAQQSQYKKMITAVIAQSGSLAGSTVATGSPESLITPTATLPPIDTTVRQSSKDEVAIYVLFETGCGVATLSELFGVPTETIHTIIGRTIAEDRPFADKVRSVAERLGK